MKADVLSKKYLKDRHRCPFCKSKEDLYVSLIPEHRPQTARCKVRTECHSCGRKWHEIFELIGIEVGNESRD